MWSTIYYIGLGLLDHLFDRYLNTVAPTAILFLTDLSSLTPCSPAFIYVPNLGIKHGMLVLFLSIIAYWFPQEVPLFDLFLPPKSEFLQYFPLLYALHPDIITH